MVMVSVRATGTLWRANAPLFVSLAIGVVNRRPTAVDVTLYFRGNANEKPTKSAHHQRSDLYIAPWSTLHKSATLHSLFSQTKMYFSGIILAVFFTFAKLDFNIVILDFHQQIS